MAAKALQRLIESIAYPADELRGDANVKTLVIDDHVITAEEREGALAFVWEVRTASSNFAKLLSYEAGRILREDAALAYDPERKSLILWSKVDSDASTDAVRDAFQKFLDSCDWWRDRVRELAVETLKVSEMVIRP